MASVEALAAVQVSADWRHRAAAPAEAGSAWAASVDLKDGFHQFLLPHLAEWFVFDLADVRAAELGVTLVYDGELGTFVDVGADDFVWPAYGGMAMGWSWALWVCHETLASVMADMALPRDVSVLDKQPAPSLVPGITAAAPYVDNANVLGLDRDLVQSRLQRVTDRLDELGLVWHERQDASVEVEILGVIIDGRSGTIRPKPARLRWLHAGLTMLVRWGHAAGWQVRRSWATWCPSSSCSALPSPSSATRTTSSPTTSRTPVLSLLVFVTSSGFRSRFSSWPMGSGGGCALSRTCLTPP